MTEDTIVTALVGCLLGWEVMNLILWRMKKFTTKEFLLWGLGPLALVILILLALGGRKKPAGTGTKAEPYEPPKTDPGVVEANRVIDERVTTDIAAIEEAEAPPEDESLEARVARLTRMQKEIG